METRYSCLTYICNSTECAEIPQQRPAWKTLANTGISSEKPRVLIDRRLSVAPMMDWTDRHCRYLHRLFSPHALLYTEMIVSTALVRGDARRLLEHSAAPSIRWRCSWAAAIRRSWRRRRASARPRASPRSI